MLAFNTERFDEASNAASTMHDNSTNNSRLTCRVAGIYEIIGCVEFASNGTGTRWIAIRINGASSIGKTLLVAGAGDTHTLTVSSHWKLAVNDYAELLAFQSSGGALNVTVGASYSPEFSMVRVG